ncbi:MAG TPA: TIGR02206 family membrane protein [Gemmatimonadota bacterium]|nr:TIGR02206 family membrane protein [Gemmatimonadota bacterium]
MSQAHAAAVGLTAAASVGLAALVRARPASGPSVRAGLAGFLLAGAAGYVAAEWRLGVLSPWDFLPLHLCDFAIFAAAFALLTHRRGAVELVWFWALTGTLLAIVTPAVSGSFPDWRWILYFAMHGGVIAAAVVIVVGCGIRPRKDAPWRVFGWTALYAAVIAIVDFATGANFLWLRAKPLQPTPLDWLGPWPIYILAAGAIGLVGFHLLALPFRTSRSRIASNNVIHYNSK